MKVVDHTVYVGPSIYANFRVVRLTVDLGVLEEWPSTRLGGPFVDGLLRALPGLREHGCSLATDGGFVRRLTEDPGTWLGHVLEHAALELQNVAGHAVTFGRTRSAGTPGVYDVVYEYRDEDIALEAGDLTLQLLLSLLPPDLVPTAERADDFDWVRERDRFLHRARKRAFGPSTRALIDAADERGIPWARLDHQNLVQLGDGVHQSWIDASLTSETGHIPVEVAADKEETNRLLAALGVPVPRQRMVHDPEQAVRAAKEIGYPVVTKPLNANHGRGVSIHLTDPDAVRTGFQEAQRHARAVLVESFVEGRDYRMLVVDGRMVAAAQREPGHVVGDGEHSIAGLVDLVNQDPRRGVGHENVLTRIELDTQAFRLLDLRGLGPESIPAAGEVVALRATGNLSTGGTATDVTDAVHPDNVAMVERVARAIGLDVCGVDFLTPDASSSHREVGGAICEVNAAPGLRMHLAPSEGRKRDVAGPIIEMLFPAGAPSRIPIATITGTNGKTTTARMLGHILKSAGHTVGMTTTDGVYIDGRLTVPGDMTGPFAARVVLRDPSVDVAVLETARGGLLRRGLGCPTCDVGACLNVQGDHLGGRGVDTIEQLARVKRIVVEAATGTAVLNADDPHCLRMAAFSRADELCYVTTEARHPLVREHIRAGGRACALEDGVAGAMIVLFDRGEHIPLAGSHEIPATVDGRAFHNLRNAMFAASIAFSMDVPVEDIRRGLRTFDASFLQVPGRTNLYDRLPFRVVLDYGHNAAAVRAMVRFTEQLETTGRRVVVLAAPGDRRDEDVRAVARAAAGHFDHYLCRRDDDARGRGPTEVPELLRDALIEADVPADAISIVPHEPDAVDAALAMARRGDLVLLFGDQVQRCWEQIVGHHPGNEATVTLPRRGITPQPAVAIAELDSELAMSTLVRRPRGVYLPCRDEDDGDD